MCNENYDAEMKESWAFFSKTADTLTGGKEVLIDVCGGHGLIAMLFLAFRKVGCGFCCSAFAALPTRRLPVLPRRLSTGHALLHAPHGQELLS